MNVLAAILVAVLPLAPADTGLPYGLTASRAELNAMNAQLYAGLRVPGITIMDQERIASGLKAAGFDQNTTDRSCASVDCALKIGRALHADAIVFGRVTREMAVVWSTSVSLADPHTGKLVRELNVGYKGDVQAMELGERYAGQCIARILKRQKPCAADKGW